MQLITTAPICLDFKLSRLQNMGYFQALPLDVEAQPRSDCLQQSNLSCLLFISSRHHCGVDGLQSMIFTFVIDLLDYIFRLPLYISNVVS